MEHEQREEGEGVRREGEQQQVEGGRWREVGDLESDHKEPSWRSSQEVWPTGWVGSREGAWLHLKWAEEGLYSYGA